MQRYEQGNRWCEVGELRNAFHQGEPCYELDGRGDEQYYLGDAGVLLHIERYPDNAWTIKYRPNDNNFLSHAHQFMELGAWKPLK